MFKSRGTVKCGVCTSSRSSVCKPLKSLEIWTSTLIIKVSRTGVVFWLYWVWNYCASRYYVCTYSKSCAQRKIFLGGNFHAKISARRNFIYFLCDHAIYSLTHTLHLAWVMLIPETYLCNNLGCGGCFWWERFRYRQWWGMRVVMMMIAKNMMFDRQNLWLKHRRFLWKQNG